MAEPQPDLERVAALRAQLASHGFVDLDTTVAMPFTLGCIFLGMAILMALFPSSHPRPGLGGDTATIVAGALTGLTGLALVPTGRLPVRVDDHGIHPRFPCSYDIAWSALTSVTLWQPGPGYGPRWVLASVDPDSLSGELSKGSWRRTMARMAHSFGEAGYGLPRFRDGNATVTAFLAAEMAARRAAVTAAGPGVAVRARGQAPVSLITPSAPASSAASSASGMSPVIFGAGGVHARRAWTTSP